MDKICPVCNEIKPEFVKCEKCENIMVDKGRVQEFLDPYGAEMPIDDRENFCLHIFKCEKCGNMKRVRVEKVII